MKSYSLFGVNDLRYIDLDLPLVEDGWALVKVKACGICSSDIPRIFKKGTYHFPTIPGHEFSGIVVNAGSEKDKEWIGKNVGVFPLIPCKKCASCNAHHYEMCDNYDYLGSRRDGGFSEYVAVPIWNLIELPSNISYETAALLEPLAVALHAIKQANLKLGSSVAIIGTGMIAFAAAQWAHLFTGEKVYVFGRNEEKRALANSIEGIDYKIDSSNETYDVVLEAVGSNQSIIKAIEMVSSGGTLVLMGNPEGDITLDQNVYWRILRKQLNLIGTWNSSYECSSASDWSDVVDFIKEGKINVDSLITHRFNHDNLPKALELMLNHKEMYCKVITIWENEEDKK